MDAPGEQAHAVDAGGGAETLSPRQPVQPTPYSMFATQAFSATHALRMPWSGLSGVPTGLIKDFVVADGESVTAGDVVALLNSGEVTTRTHAAGAEYVFNAAAPSGAGGSGYVASAALSDSRFVVVYKDLLSLYGTAIIGTVYDGTISWGQASAFETVVSYHSRIAVLSPDKFVVAYNKTGDYKGMARVAQVDGDAITWGPEREFYPSYRHALDVAALAKDKFVVAFRDYGIDEAGHAKVGIVSGLDISFGAMSEYSADQEVWGVVVAGLTEDKFVLAYRHQSPNDIGMVRIGTVSGDSLSWGQIYTFNTISTDYMAAAALTDSQFVLAYRDKDNSYYGTAITGVVTGVDIALGVESVFNPANSVDSDVVTLADDQFMIAYRDVSGVKENTTIVGTVSPTGITWSEKVPLYERSGDSIEAKIALLSEDTYVLAYADIYDHLNGKAVLVQALRPLGVAQASASDGEMAPVMVAGISPRHSGLTPNATYYWAADGALTTNFTSRRVGEALSARQLLLDLDSDTMCLSGEGLERQGATFALADRGVSSDKLNTTVTTLSADATLDVSQAGVVLVSGNTTITLPDPANAAGVEFTIKNVDTGAVTIDGGGGYIDGSASQSLAVQYGFITVVSDGGDWWIIGTN